MKIKPFILILVIISVFLVAKAQSTDGNVTIFYNNPDIKELVELHKNYNEEFPVLDGYRIQLIMRAGNTALDEANKIKEEFELEYPGVKTYITFREPYYRLRVGDFRSRLDAMEFMENIKRSYPQAWVIKDKISFPELTNK